MPPAFRMRLQHMEELRLRRAADAAAGTLAAAVGGGEDGEDGSGLIPIALPARKRRVIDVLQETLGADSEEGGTDEEDEEDLVLDWRQKGV